MENLRCYTQGFGVEQTNKEKRKTFLFPSKILASLVYRNISDYGPKQGLKKEKQELSLRFVIEVQTHPVSEDFHEKSFL